MPVVPTITYSHDNSGEQSGSEREVVTNYNKLVQGLSRFFNNLGGSGLITTSILARGPGTGATLAVGASVAFYSGVKSELAAVASQAFGALGSIPANTWGVIGVQRVTAGTVTFVSGANNYTTGYATEAAAIAALPAAGANNIIIGYITVKASEANVWVAGTSGLAGGTAGNPAQATNYYPTPAIFGTLPGDAKIVGDMDGIPIVE